MKKIKIISKTRYADINHDCVVMKLLELGHKRKNYKTIHGTGEFYDEYGESMYIIYDNGTHETSSLLEVCKAADVELDPMDMEESDEQD